MLDTGARVRLRAAATDFLAAELPRLRAAGSLPDPERDSPWIDHQRLWRVLGYRVGADFGKALEAEAPGRWTGPTASPGAEEYAEALLRGVIAAATVAGVNPTEFAGTPALIEELLDHVENPVQPVRVARLLTDMDSSAVDGRAVHDVRLRNVRDLLRTLSREIPEAAAEVRRLHASLGSYEPRTLLIAEASGHDPWHVAFDARPHIGHVATALRLVTAGTSVVPIEVYGQPATVHVGGPTVSPEDPEPMFTWRRVGRIDPEQIEGIDALATRVCGLEKPAGDVVPPPLAVALSRFNRSYRPAGWADVVIDIAIGLEAALSSGDKEEVTLRVRTRAASLLARRGDPATAIFHDIGDLLDVRGKVAHGSIVEPKHWSRLFEARGLDQVMVEAKRSVLFDRWRDILRRAILARLMLADEVWPLDGRMPAIDEVLVGAAGRHAWRLAIRRRACELGIGASLDPPPPLEDFLHAPYSNSLNH